MSGNRGATIVGILLLCGSSIAIGLGLGRLQRTPHQSPPRARLAPAITYPERPAGAYSCQSRGTGCAAYLVSLMNAARGTTGSRGGLVLDWALTNKTATCEGAKGHAMAERASGSIWHVNPAYPKDSFPTAALCSTACQQDCMALAENTGEASGAKASALLADFEQMMAEEPHDAASCASIVSHACNILNPRYTRVGIGLAGESSGPWYVVEDFAGS